MRMLPPVLYFLKWLAITLIIGALAGSASAFFLVALDRVTAYRETHERLIFLLPLAGLFIGLLYHYFGNGIAKGNNLVIEEIHRPSRIVPLVMAPFILFSTLVTHLFGGSAGREGTAVQIGGALADQFSRWFGVAHRDRHILLICGISAGFASVFGTPLAGTVFALEVFLLGSMRYQALFPALLSAIFADQACRLWGVGHTTYPVAAVPAINIALLGWTAAAGIIFGLAARFFSVLNHWLGARFSRHIGYPPLRPLAGGLLIVSLLLIAGTRYAGLGIPVIVESFTRVQPPETFGWKILLTCLTLGAGFKGGEVTPLFFIGAALGSCLSAVMPLPVSLLAAMGFAAVFAAAANTPLACILMGVELFGSGPAVYVAVACVLAYLVSGQRGIYSAQQQKDFKTGLWNDVSAGANTTP
ncbi:chloride channel protein [Pedobacter yulinensis]|uniref:Chloride channel protein n=1 Tax=Pedobacter yulinensis TaxID=2126353 RepID=A0A2T3HQR1_9SPHI|nr:voltage-gated chloride channel family protein [Pedobacter yulinensis]PST84756.1 chloride channel protein [Pedobacter yulinensis]